jgi:hypothetical protein
MVASTGSTGEVISKLRELQDKDFYIFRSKTHVNRLSLGVFSQLDNALRRQAKLEELGVSSEVIDRSFRKQASPVIVTSVIRPTSVETELVETESVGAESVGAESVTTKRVRTKRVRTKSVTVTESNLKPAGIRASSEPELADRRTFLVAATGETNTTVLKLLKLKFNDYQVLRSAPFNNRLSLGVFSQAGNARRRQAMLLSMGIETELFERPRPRLEQVTLSATTGVQDD